MQENQKRQDMIRIGIIVAIALVIRITYFVLNHANNPTFNHPILDSLFHLEWARAINDGSASTDAYFRAPFYPYLLALQLKFGGSIASMIFVQHLVGAVSCGLLYQLARRYFSVGIATTSGIIMALYWPLVFFEGQLLIVTTFIFLILLALNATARAWERPTLATLGVAGLILGLAAITRPSILIVIIAIPIMFLQGRERLQSAGSSWWRASLILLAGVAIMITPVMVRNRLIADSFVPIATSGGVNFYIGNNIDSDGRTAIVPGTDAPWIGGNREAIAIAATEAGRELTPTEASAFYFRKGLDFLTTHPTGATRLWISKLALFWEGAERSNERAIHFFWHLSGMGKVPLLAFWIIGPLGLAGMVLLMGRRRELSLLYVFTILYMVGVIAFFVNARLRLPVVPVVIIFASYALATVVSAVRDRRWGSLTFPLILVALAFLAVDMSYPAFLKSREKHRTISYYAIAGSYLEENRKLAAIIALEKARDSFEEDPNDAYAIVARDIYMKLGGLRWERGECDLAIAAFNRVGGSDEQTVVAKGLLADCYERGREFEKAMEVYHDILHIAPKYEAAWLGMARCYESVGLPKRAQAIRESLVRGSSPDHPTHDPTAEPEPESN